MDKDPDPVEQGEPDISKLEVDAKSDIPIPDNTRTQVANALRPTHDIKQKFLNSFTDEEKPQMIRKFQDAEKSTEATKLFEVEIGRNLSFVAYKAEARFGGGIVFRIMDGKDVKTQITFNPEESGVLGMVHREVQSQSLGISGSSFLRKIEEYFQILKEANALTSATSYSVDAGQSTVIQWALRNGYEFKDLEQRMLFESIISAQNDKYVIVDVGEGALFDHYIFHKETLEKHKDEIYADPTKAKDYSVRFQLTKSLGNPVVDNGLSKMEKVDLKTYLQTTNPRWRAALERFSPDVQRELIVERPNPIDEDIEEASRCEQIGTVPVVVKLKTLLEDPGNLDCIARSPVEVINRINELWSLNVTPGKTYDQDPARYFRYSKLNGATAKPSIMINGAIAFGVARFIAALLRKDEDMKVWNLRRSDP